MHKTSKDVTMAEGGTEPKPSDNQASKFQLEVNECLGNWLMYLQVCVYFFYDFYVKAYKSKLFSSMQTLNGLCTAGTKLAQSLHTLLSAHDTLTQCRITGQCLAGWEELTRATYIASNTVKNHIISALRDHETRENEGDKHVHIYFELFWKIIAGNLYLTDFYIKRCNF